MRSEKAYSLIELICVLSIIAILITLVTLNAKYLTPFSTQKEINNLVRDLDINRNDAISANSKNKISFDKINYRYHVFEDGVKTKTVELNHINYLNLAGNMGEIIFSETGAPLRATTIYLETDSKKIYHITVEVATGKVNVKEFGR